VASPDPRIEADAATPSEGEGRPGQEPLEPHPAGEEAYPVSEVMYCASVKWQQPLATLAMPRPHFACRGGVRASSRSGRPAPYARLVIGGREASRARSPSTRDP
jgi:hypothetical protein